MPPTVTGVFPHRDLPFSLVFITGSGFTGATEVDFGRRSAEFAVLSDGVIVAVVPPDHRRRVTVDVTVTTPAGTSAPSAADSFEYVRDRFDGFWWWWWFG